MIKEIVISIFYISGAFAPGFDEKGNSVIPQSVWIEQVKDATDKPVKVRVFKRKNFAPELQTLDNWMKYSYRAFTFLKRQKAKGIKVAATGPLIDLNNVRYVAGLAKKVCSPLSGIVVANIQETRSNGLDAKYPSAIVIAHEVGHALGAYHDDSYCNIMSSNAASCAAVAPVEFSSTSKRFIRQCLKRGMYFD